MLGRGQLVSVLTFVFHQWIDIFVAFAPFVRLRKHLVHKRACALFLFVAKFSSIVCHVVWILKLWVKSSGKKSHNGCWIWVCNKSETLHITLRLTETARSLECPAQHQACKVSETRVSESDVTFWNILIQMMSQPSYLLFLAFSRIDILNIRHLEVAL